jgi:peptide deformylase
LGHPALKAENQIIQNFVDPKLAQLIIDLKDTMYKEGLIGIAAPQIGENYMVFITEPRETEYRPADQADEFRVYINPKILWESDEKIIIWEACGSVTEVGIFGPVLRSKIVEVEAQDITGNKFKFKADGILGRVIQHEMDHCLGIEFIEKVADYGKLKSLEFYLKDIKTSPEQVAAQKISIKELS